MKQTNDILVLIGEAYAAIDQEEQPNSHERWLRRQMAHAYGFAIDRALELGHMDDLYRMLKAEVPIPSCMLPVIAKLIARPTFPQKSGARATFSRAEKTLMCGALKHHVFAEGMRITHFYNEWEERFGVKVHTFKRIWREHKSALKSRPTN
jgi:hypothetical protein